MPRFNLLAKPQPVIGILLVAGGWTLSHQWGSNWVFDRCYQGGGTLVVAVSLLGLLITAGGGLYCLLAWRTSGGSGRRLLGALGALLALIVGFAIVLQIAAGVILPICAA